MFRFQGGQTRPWEPVKHKMLRCGLFKKGLRGIYDPGDFTKSFHRFPCSSHNNRVLTHSPALKTWTSLKENGGEKKDIKGIKTVFVLTSEIRLRSFPLTGVQPIKFNVSTSSRKYSFVTFLFPVQLEAAAQHKNVFCYFT